MKGNVDVNELKDRTQARAHQSDHEMRQKAAAPDLMNPYGIKHRECLASDNHPDPLPTVFLMDTSGSMGIVPRDLARKDLPRLLERQTQMGSIGRHTSQICMCGVADLEDTYPLQLGQFEGDNRIDDWLLRIQIGGGGGSERMHEAYMLGLYFLARKTSCTCWNQQKKGYAFITGDEMCNPVLRRDDIQRIFGDSVPRDLHLESLLEEVRQKWHLSFLYVHTGSYGSDMGEQKIWPFWKHLLGKDAYQLDGRASGLPELVNAIIGIHEGNLDAQTVPQDLLELGCEPDICNAVATSLNVPAPRGGDVQGQGSKKARPRRL